MKSVKNILLSSALIFSTVGFANNLSNDSNQVNNLKNIMASLSQNMLEKNPTATKMFDSFELRSFDATNINGTIELKWVTKTELHNQFFTVEKSKDGKEWEKVLVMGSAGNSDQLLEYYGMDNNPIDGISFYRLGRTNNAGEFQVINTVTVINSSNGKTELVSSKNLVK